MGKLTRFRDPDGKGYVKARYSNLPADEQIGVIPEDSEAVRILADAIVGERWSGGHWSYEREDDCIAVHPPR